MTQEALKLALEALKRATNYDPVIARAITAIKEALAQHDSVQAKPEPEPVAWMYQCSADNSGPVLMQHKRDWAESGSGLWTETPLYTKEQL